jgi:hypothetical protein
VRSIGDENVVVRYDDGHSEHCYTKGKVESGRFVIIGHTDISQFNVDGKVRHHSHGTGIVTGIEGGKVRITFDKGLECQYDEPAIKTGKMLLVDYVQRTGNRITRRRYILLSAMAN